MLTKMVLENFLSFSEKTEFDFTPSKYTILNKTNVFHDTKYLTSVLKGSLFIGPNASGKTNALEGIMFLLKTLEDKPLNYDRYICMFNQAKGLRVSYEFCISGKTIVYLIEYEKDRSELSERLILDGEEILVRTGDTGELKLGAETVITTPLDSKTTFLRTASFNTGRFPQRSELRAFMDYLFNSGYVQGDNLKALFGQTVKAYAEANGVEKINQYLKDFQYDFVTEYTSRTQGNGVRLDFGDKKEIILKRKTFPAPFPLQWEAQGNKVFVDLLPLLIDVIEKPGMLIIDEFGNSLHNELAERIVRYFMKRAINSQFFITSHCTNLISNSVFRPDQINLVTFDGPLGSCVERISRFKPREAQNLEKMYLGGMFEGLPNYGEEI